MTKMQNAASAPISFSLNDTDVVDLRAIAGFEGSPQWMPRAFVAIGIFNVIVFALDFLRHPHEHESYMGFVGIYFIGFGLYAMRRRSGPPPFAQRADLEIDDVGIRGTREGRAVSVPWKRVRSVRDAGPFFIVRFDGFTGQIALPKRAIDDSAAMWSFFEDKLTAKRGLVVRPGRKLLVNSAR
jgi:hypothetical protein